jgi:hypothetical protein
MLMNFHFLVAELKHHTHKNNKKYAQLDNILNFLPYTSIAASEILSSASTDDDDGDAAAYSFSLAKRGNTSRTERKNN